ncbi:hypothetical protein [Rothia nasisuis]|uniref:hypothetical protein n=1 Tax=Rothia nasisuis TaxID=2109647 RepID=UPI001F42775D|nr:hypothetical protein [Rothia nasisuis]
MSSWNLPKEVVALSCADDFDAARHEWDLVDRGIDPTSSQNCVCGKEGLKYLFTIRNRETGAELYPIGSSCIELFGRKDLDQQVGITKQMYEVLAEYRETGSLRLNGGAITRAVLRQLYEEGCFPPNDYNHRNPKIDYEFLVERFNQRSEPTEGQRKKIWVLLNKTVGPYLERTLGS